MDITRELEVMGHQMAGHPQVFVAKLGEGKGEEFDGGLAVHHARNLIIELRREVEYLKSQIDRQAPRPWENHLGKIADAIELLAHDAVRKDKN
jgi:hypothetical protein